MHLSAQSVNTNWADKKIQYIAKENTYLNIGDTIPNFDIYINGQVRRIREIAKDNYIYIDLWSNDLEITSSNKLELKYIYNKFLKNKNDYKFNILSICLGDETKWQKETNEYNISWLNAFSKDDSCLNNWFDLSELPCGIVIDNNGVILLKKINSMSERNNAFDMLIKVQTISKITKEENLKNNYNNSYTKLKVVGKNPKNYQVRIGNDVYIDSLKSMNIINIEIEEPTKIITINANDTVALLKKDFKYINLYIENGVNEITIDLDKSAFYSNTSKLINEYNEFMQLKNKFDTITKHILDTEYKSTQLRTNNNKLDSISHIYHREYYNKCLALPKSFITLKFVQFLTDGYLQAGIARKEVVTLFNLLDNSLFNYPTYKKTKKIIEDNFINKNIELKDTISKPLWNPN